MSTKSVREAKAANRKSKKPFQLSDVTKEDMEAWLVYYFENEQDWQVCTTWVRKFPKLAGWVRAKQEEVYAKVMEEEKAKLLAQFKKSVKDTSSAETILTALLSDAKLVRELYRAT